MQIKVTWSSTMFWWFKLTPCSKCKENVAYVATAKYSKTSFWKKCVHFKVTRLMVVIGLCPFLRHNMSIQLLHGQKVRHNSINQCLISCASQWVRPQNFHLACAVGNEGACSSLLIRYLSACLLLKNYCPKWVPGLFQADTSFHGCCVNAVRLPWAQKQKHLW